jgi:hypothetical protein
MADKTVTTAMAHAPASADKTLLITAIDGVVTALGNAVTASQSGNAQAWTLTVTGSPTGGTYEVTVVDDINGTQTLTLAYNASAATVQAAFRTLTGTGYSLTTVSATGTTPNFTHTVQFKGTRADVTITVDDSELTGGSSPAVAPAESSAYAELVRFSEQSKNVMLGELVNWAENLASNLRTT